ncbi:MAG TPA: hypothetical protein VMV47_05235 [Bacteroidales bacterium]|nr:hypothetical protein [Bacteroidales bacterium]
MEIRIIAIIISLAALGMFLWLLFGKGQKPWNEMSKDEQKKKKILVTGGILVFLAGVLTAIFAGKKK